MRPEERIDIFLDVLRKEWKKDPDLRFCQFLFNIGINETGGIDYHLEEHELLTRSFPNIKPRDYLLWGTLGKNGKGPRKYKLIKDMSKAHIQQILKDYKDKKLRVSPKYLKAFIEELAIRKKK